MFLELKPLAVDWSENCGLTFDFDYDSSVLIVLWPFMWFQART